MIRKVTPVKLVNRKSGRRCKNIRKRKERDEEGKWVSCYHIAYNLAYPMRCCNAPNARNSDGADLQKLAGLISEIVRSMANENQGNPFLEEEERERRECVCVRVCIYIYVYM